MNSDSLWSIWRSLQKEKAWSRSSYSLCRPLNGTWLQTVYRDGQHLHLHQAVVADCRKWVSPSLPIILDSNESERYFSNVAVGSSCLYFWIAFVLSSYLLIYKWAETWWLTAELCWFSGQPFEAASQHGNLMVVTAQTGCKWWHQHNTAELFHVFHF